MRSYRMMLSSPHDLDSPTEGTMDSSYYLPRQRVIQQKPHDTYDAAIARSRFHSHGHAEITGNTETSGQEMLLYLSMVTSEEQILSLQSYLASMSAAELRNEFIACRRQSSILSRSERSSILSRYSFQSVASSNTVDSFDFEANHMSTLSHYGASTPVHESRAQDSAYPTMASHSTSHACMGCGVVFRNENTLRRHQREKCERTHEFVCRICRPRLAFGLLDRLERHHQTKHNCDRCVTGTSEKCKESLRSCQQSLPPKKAWACSCCLKYFTLQKDYFDHSVDHGTSNGRVTNWSFNIQVASLLNHPVLVRSSTFDMSHELTRSPRSNTYTCSRSMIGTGLR